jgi:hypothetical protein
MRIVPLVGHELGKLCVGDRGLVDEEALDADTMGRLFFG